jgi:hypothetical protein
VVEGLAVVQEPGVVALVVIEQVLEHRAVEVLLKLL